MDVHGTKLRPQALRRLRRASGPASDRSTSEDVSGLNEELQRPPQHTFALRASADRSAAWCGHLRYLRHLWPFSIHTSHVTAPIASSSNGLPAALSATLIWPW